MRVLVTRPKEDAAVFAACLIELGHEPVIAPLLTVRFHDGPQITLEGVRAVLATSANGVRALARRTAQRDVPVFAVGPQTAQAARDAGFARVESAHGDVVALARALRRWARPDEGALLHATAEEGASRLAGLLTTKGYEVQTVVLYDVVASTVLPDLAARALADGALEAAFFFSPRSARIFSDCVVNAGLSRHCARLTALCISEAAAAALSRLVFASVRIAAKPNQDALLACLRSGV